MDILPERLAWYIAGPLMGLTVVALYALANRPLGATTAYAETLTFLRGRRVTERWRLWWFAGLVAGALLAAVLRGGPSLGTDYGELGDALPLLLLIPLLAVAGVIMGYGARWSGGCTSGHGLRGCSSLSPASLVATATFMATAVAVSLVLHALTGGEL
jgi:uncharacterized membrane protein YedE/YeeE